MSITSEVTWSRADIPWREDHLQMAVATYLRRANVTFAADQNEGRRSPRDGARRKAMGMAAGEPDLRIYPPNGRTLFAAATAAATAAEAACAAAARDRVLSEFSERVVEILVDMKAPGIAFLPLTGVAQ